MAARSSREGVRGEGRDGLRNRVRTVSDAQRALRYEVQCCDRIGYGQDREKQALISHIKNDLLTAADALDGRSSPHLDESNAGIFLSYEWCLADAVAKMKQVLSSP
jgi:hypothetical protein